MWLRRLGLLLCGLPSTTTTIRHFIFRDWAALAFFLSFSFSRRSPCTFSRGRLACSFLFCSPKFFFSSNELSIGGKCVKVAQQSSVSFLFTPFRNRGRLFWEGDGQKGELPDLPCPAFSCRRFGLHEKDASTAGPGIAGFDGVTETWTGLADGIKQCSGSMC